MSIACPVLEMRAMAALMTPQPSGTYGINGDAFLIQGCGRTQPLTVDRNPASQGLLCPIEATIEATKSKGSQREIPTSSSVGYDSQPTYPNVVVPADPNADPREHARLTVPLTLKQEVEGINPRPSKGEAVTTRPQGGHPGMPHGIRDTAPALYDYVCSVSQSDPNPTNPGHSELPSDMAPRTNTISARLNNSPAEARFSVDSSGTQGGTMRGSPPTVGGSLGPYSYITIYA